MNQQSVTVPNIIIHFGNFPHTGPEMKSIVPNRRTPTYLAITTIAKGEKGIKAIVQYTFCRIVLQHAVKVLGFITMLLTLALFQLQSQYVPSKWLRYY